MTTAKAQEGRVYQPAEIDQSMIAVPVPSRTPFEAAEPTIEKAAKPPEGSRKPSPVAPTFLRFGRTQRYL